MSYFCCKPFPNAKCSKKFSNISEKCRSNLKNLVSPPDLDGKKRICSNCYFSLSKNKTTNKTLPSSGEESDSKVQVKPVQIWQFSSSENETNYKSDPEPSTSTERR